MGLALHTTRIEGRALVTARGSIDLHSCDSLAGRLAELVETGDGEIVLDLTGVDFCDSSGLNVLVRAYKQARAAGAALVVTGAYGRVGDVLRLTGLDRYLIRET